MFSACRNCPRSAIQAQEEVLDPCCEPYAQPSPSSAFFTGSKKAWGNGSLQSLRWLFPLAEEGSQSSLTSVWTSLASCKSLSLVNLLRPLPWFWWDSRGSHIQLKPLKLFPVMDAWLDTSSETEGQSVVSGEWAGRKFSSTGERAPGYWLSQNYFQKFKRVLAPDWAQKMLGIIVPNRRTVSREFFSWVHTRRLLSCFTCPVRSPCKLVRARKTFIFYFPNHKRRNYRWVEKTFGMLSAGTIQFAPRIFCFWLITMYCK